MLPPKWKLVFIQQEDWFTYNEKHGTAADRSPPSSDTMFSGNGTSRGGFLPSCGIKKIPHMWYISWYLKKYHICGTKTSIVVSKDTTCVVHFADASKKGLFSDSPFCFLSASARRKQVPKRSPQWPVLAALLFFRMTVNGVFRGNLFPLNPLRKEQSRQRLAQRFYGVP